jgi:hypothetical protein
LCLWFLRAGEFGYQVADDAVRGSGCRAACDFEQVDTMLPQRVYVLFVMEV